ncbi:GNAT family N-acetyltransferase [uncultured Neptuniibacter sp.]|uniref:GNAT family N-acetyltransferase n=1 Tax=uncultured Neptuniibacter sp. TaxID=502143 RepID=UPI00262F37D9|nr:GNAT family N-acetyltransferase [uncultured Neptuniibacter sp.]
MQSRQVRESDLPRICLLPESAEELFYCFPRASFPLTAENVSKAIAERSDSTVVELNGRVVAFANFYRWGPERCSIGNVVVASSVRGAGVASYLINYMTRLAFDKHQAQEVTVSCFNQNIGGLVLYKKLGFRPYDLEERIDHNGNRVVLIHMKVGRNAV